MNINTMNNLLPKVPLTIIHSRQKICHSKFLESKTNLTYVPNYTSQFKTPTLINPLGLLGGFIRIMEKEINSKTDNIFKAVVKNALKDLKSNCNIVGEGYHDTVYRINDDYVAKISKFSSYTKGEPALEVIKDEYKDIPTYKGGILFKMGNFRILKNIGKHLPAGVAYKTDAAKVDNAYINYLLKFSNVSQDSYDNIVKDCITLNKRQINNKTCWLFDTINPNNLVLKDNKLFWVDDITVSYGTGNNLVDLLDMLLNHKRLGMYVNHGYGEYLPQARAIFEKVVLAGAKNQLPVKGTSVMTKINCNQFLKNLEIDEKAENFIDDISNIFSIQEYDKRISETKKYIDYLYSLKLVENLN